MSEVIINLNQFSSSSKVAYKTIWYCYNYSSLPQSIAFHCLRFICKLSNKSSSSFYSAMDENIIHGLYIQIFFSLLANISQFIIVAVMISNRWSVVVIVVSDALSSQSEMYCVKNETSILISVNNWSAFTPHQHPSRLIHFILTLLKNCSGILTVISSKQVLGFSIGFYVSKCDLVLSLDLLISISTPSKSISMEIQALLIFICFKQFSVQSKKADGRLGTFLKIIFLKILLFKSSYKGWNTK